LKNYDYLIDPHISWLILEFAKRLVSPNGDYSPLGPKNIMSGIKTPSMIPSIFLDFVGKGGKLTGKSVETMFSKGKSLPFSLSAKSLDKLLWTIIGPFGILKDSVGFTSKLIAKRLNDFLLWPVLEAIKRSMISDCFKEWENSKDKTLVSLSLSTKRSLGNIFEEPVINVCDFPSHRSLFVSGLETYVKVLDSNPKTDKKGSLTSVPAYLLGDREDPALFVIDLLKIRPSFSPLDNCLVKPVQNKPRIRDVNLKFYDKVHRELEKGVILY
jgi:hypothetical protein